MMTDREFAAWGAGMLEGEGTVAIKKPARNKQCTLKVAVNNTDITLLEPLQKRWGGAIQQTLRRTGNQRPCFTWVAHTRVGAQYLKDALPFLQSPRQIARAELAIAFQERKAKHHRGYRLSEKTKAAEAEDREILMLLNDRERWREGLSTFAARGVA